MSACFTFCFRRRCVNVSSIYFVCHIYYLSNVNMRQTAEMWAWFLPAWMRITFWVVLSSVVSVEDIMISLKTHSIDLRWSFITSDTGLYNRNRLNSFICTLFGILNSTPEKRKLPFSTWNQNCDQFISAKNIFLKVNLNVISFSRSETILQCVAKAVFKSSSDPISHPVN